MQNSNGKIQNKKTNQATKVTMFAGSCFPARQGSDFKPFAAMGHRY